MGEVGEASSSAVAEHDENAPETAAEGGSAPQEDQKKSSDALLEELFFAAAREASFENVRERDSCRKCVAMETGAFGFHLIGFSLFQAQQAKKASDAILDELFSIRDSTEVRCVDRDACKVHDTPSGSRRHRHHNGRQACTQGGARRAQPLALPQSQASQAQEEQEGSTPYRIPLTVPSQEKKSKSKHRSRSRDRKRGDRRGRSSSSDS